MTLNPLTILVGPTATGKTTVLAALDPTVSVNYRDYWRHQTNEPVSFDLEFDTGPPSFRAVSTTRVQKVPSRPYREYGYQRLHLDPRRMREPVTVAHEPSLTTDGRNIDNVVASLSRRQQVDLADALCRLLPQYADVDVRPFNTSKGQHRLLFQDRWQSDTWYTSDEVSDGTLLALGLLLIPFQQEVPELVAIEEPERGLHPSLLAALLETFRQLAAGRAAIRPVQVILATQSSAILDHALPAEVRFISRSKQDGSTRVNQAGQPGDSWMLDALQQYRTLRSG